SGILSPFWHPHAYYNWSKRNIAYLGDESARCGGQAFLSPIHTPTTLRGKHPNFFSPCSGAFFFYFLPVSASANISSMTNVLTTVTRPLPGMIAARRGANLV